MTYKMKTELSIIVLFLLFSTHSVYIAQDFSSELVPIKELIPSVVLDLKYSTTDNVF